MNKTDNQTKTTKTAAMLGVEVKESEIKLKSLKDKLKAEKKPFVDILESIQKQITEVEERHRADIEAEDKRLNKLDVKLKTAELAEQVSGVMDRIADATELTEDFIKDLIRARKPQMNHDYIFNGDKGIDNWKFDDKPRGSIGVAKANGLMVIAIQNGKTGWRKSYLAFDGLRCVAYQLTKSYGAYQPSDTKAFFAFDVEHVYSYNRDASTIKAGNRVPMNFTKFMQKLKDTSEEDIKNAVPLNLIDFGRSPLDLWG